MGARETSPGRFDVTDLIQKTYDTGIILNALLYDYFRPFRAGFDQFPTKKAKIQFLIESLEGTPEIDRLLDLMARDYPSVYRRYADLLQRQPS